MVLLTWIQILKVILANSVTLENIPSWGKKKKEGKIDTSQSLLKSMNQERVLAPSRCLMWESDLMFPPSIPHLVFVEAKQMHGTSTWGQTKSLAFSNDSRSLVYFHFPYSHGLDPEVQALASHDVIMHCWDENLLGASSSSPILGP